MSEEPLDRRNITFAQAEGAEELPRQLALKEVSPELRAATWYMLHDLLNRSRRQQDYNPDLVGFSWQTVLTKWHVRRKHRMIDEISFQLDRQLKHVKAIITTEDYVGFFDFLQFLIRDKDTPIDAKKYITQLLISTRSAYRVVDGDTIAPVGSEIEAAAIANALSVTKPARFGGARNHLRSAAEHVTSGRWADSVRESIHAVESVALTLAPGTKELGPALNALEATAKLHGALKEAFKKLYGFTSDDEGIRHALVLKDAASVDEADAMFMLGACASFVTFLIARAPAQPPSA